MENRRESDAYETRRQRGSLRELQERLCKSAPHLPRISMMSGLNPFLLSKRRGRGDAWRACAEAKTRCWCGNRGRPRLQRPISARRLRLSSVGPQSLQIEELDDCEAPFRGTRVAPKGLWRSTSARSPTPSSWTSARGVACSSAPARRASSCATAPRHRLFSNIV